MKLKHWMMESLSRARKKSKSEHTSRDSDTNPITTTSKPPSKDIMAEKTASSSRGRRLSVKEIIMPLHNVPRERKYVRDNYPAVAAYLDHHQRQPLANVGNLRSFRPTPPPLPPAPPVCREPKYRGYERLYANLSPDPVYTAPSCKPAHTSCSCYRHEVPSERNGSISENSMDMSSSVSGTLNSRRVNIRTNPWIAPNGGETGSFVHASLQRKTTGTAGKGTIPPVPPPKPLRKRPPPAVVPVQQPMQYDEEEDSEMVICSDKSVGTDGDEYLFEGSSSCCDECEDCCSSSCTSFSSLKFSSGPFFSSDTIQACDSDTSCSITSTPTILNDFDDADAENSSERDSAVDSPGSRQTQPTALTTSLSGGSSRRHHFSPADSHTSWKYFDDDDEVDSGHGQTASSLGSPGSAGDFSSRHISHSNSSHSATSSKRMFVEDDTREEFTDIDTNIEIIRGRLQKQVFQLKHEQTALDWRMLCSMEDYNVTDTETMIEEDFIVQKKAILAETLDLLKRQLEEQNYRLQNSHLALQNLQRRQGKRNEPRNRDCRALSALYNENIRETFC